MEKTCQNCNQTFYRPAYAVSESFWNARKYCSVDCGYKSKIGVLKSEKLQKSCLSCGSNFLVGTWRFKARCCSIQCEQEYRLSKEWRKKMSIVMRKTKGATAPQISRKSIEYRLWRESVFIRDDYTCKECGVRGTELNADHIKPFALYPELRYDISNGRTLCVPCHIKTPTYGYNTVIMKRIKIT